MCTTTVQLFTYLNIELYASNHDISYKKSLILTGFMRYLPSLRLILAFVTILLISPLNNSAYAYQQDPNADVRKGLDALNKRDYDRARDAFDQAIKSGHDIPQAKAGLAHVDMARNKWPDALKTLDALLEDYPDYLHGLYLRGITNREIAKYRPLNQKKYWNAALQDFGIIESKDSTYKDVLFQHALVHRYQGDFEKAIDLGHLQLIHKPDSLLLVKHLFTLYEYYIRNTPSDVALSNLSKRQTTYDYYFEGELLRRNNELERADAIFKRILTIQNDIVLHPVYLSRARVFYAQDEARIAQSHVAQAITSIETLLDAQLVLDDFKYLLLDQELEEFESLNKADEFIQFFEAFWARRNPMPARPENARMTEHYRRLLIAEQKYEYDGFRLWHNDPDRLGAFSFPRSYQLNEEFNDKGLIFIRLGEPSDTEIQVSGSMETRSVIDNTTVYGSPVEYSTSQGWRPNESWRYFNPLNLDFHFILADGGLNAWMLVPDLINADMIISREHWGGIYYEMADAARAMQEIQEGALGSYTAGDATSSSLDEETQSQFAGSQDSLLSTGTLGSSVNLDNMDANNRRFLEFASLQRRMVDRSVTDVKEGLSSDRHTWAKEVESFPMPHQIATFRGEDGTTRVDVFFALPIGQISNSLGKTTGSLEIEMGYAVHDTTWQEVTKDAIAKRLPAHEEAEAAAIDFFTFSVPADSYMVSIFGRSMGSDQLAGYKIPYRIPNYAPGNLAISDLVLADFIGPAQSGSRFNRGDLHVSPNPFSRFSKLRSVFVYFEIYDLTLGNNDTGQFAIEYSIASKENRRRIFKRKQRPLLSLQIDRTTTTSNPIEFAEIDVQSLDPGTYEFTVRITDQQTDTSTESSQTLILHK